MFAWGTQLRKCNLASVVSLRLTLSVDSLASGHPRIRPAKGDWRGRGRDPHILGRGCDWQAADGEGGIRRRKESVRYEEGVEEYVHKEEVDVDDDTERGRRLDKDAGHGRGR